MTSIGSTLFAGGSTLIAAFAIYYQARVQNNQKLLDQAQLSLERAYETLSTDGKVLSPPSPVRLNWLTAARHIQRYKILKSQLKDKTHITICEEQEEYWRHRIYLCLATKEPIQPSYYQEKLGEHRMQAIDPTSALVIHAFAKWPKDRADPLDSADSEELIEKGCALQGNPGLQAYIEEKSR